MSNKPIHTLRDGKLSVAIWKNEGDNGSFYSVTFQRVYTDSDGETQNTSTFSSNDLLRIANLATIAYNKVTEMKRSDASRERLSNSSPD